MKKVFQKIFSIASSLTNAYLFSKENEKPIIPANLWAMLKHSSDHLELNPVFVLWAPLHVVKRLDKDAEPTFENIQMEVSFTKTITEKYFFECNYLFEYYFKDFLKKTFDINHICWRHVRNYGKLNDRSAESPNNQKLKNFPIDKEIKFENLFNNNIDSYNQITNGNYENNEINNNQKEKKISNCGQTDNNIDNNNQEEEEIDLLLDELTSDEINFINKSFEELQSSQRKVLEFCKLLLTKMDASVFYNELRIFIRGYSAFTNGVGVEGSSEILQLSGSSAGQDPMISLQKLFFGITFSENFKNYQKILLDYIRKPHLHFLQIVEKYSLIHKLQHHKEIQENYNSSKNLLMDFYKVHKAYVLSFISSPAKQRNLNSNELYGVGGTPINIVKNIHNYFVEKK